MFEHHKFDKWSNPFVAIRDAGPFGNTYKVTLQSRTCTKCGKVETRKVYDGILPHLK